MLIAGSIRFLRALKITLVPDYHRFSQTKLVGFISPIIVDKTIDKTIVNDSTGNEDKKIGLEKPVVIWY